MNNPDDLLTTVTAIERAMIDDEIIPRDPEAAADHAAAMDALVKLRKRIAGTS